MRSEADLERAICLALCAQKKKFVQKFLYLGDKIPFVNGGIKNSFLLALAKENRFVIKDIFDEFLLLRSAKSMLNGKFITNKDFNGSAKGVIQMLYSYLLRVVMTRNIVWFIKRYLKRYQVDVLMCDISNENKDYPPQIFREIAIKMGISVYIYGHGAGGALHGAFAPQPLEIPKFSGATVFVNNSYEVFGMDNRIILGDVCSSYPYVHFLNRLRLGRILVGENIPYKVAFFIGGTANSLTSTNGWKTMEEIIIDLSERADVFCVLKLHPREEEYMDLRMLKTFENILIVGNEIDRSRLVQWSNVVVTSDHTSVVFEPMILGKKVVAVEGKHIPSYKNCHSPLKNSSINFVSSAEEFILEKLNACEDYVDPIVNELAWGGNGPIDLAEKLWGMIMKTEKHR